MKKLMTVATVAIMAVGSFADTTPISTITNSVPLTPAIQVKTNEVVDVYDFTMSLKVPYVVNGDRVVNSQTMKGYLYMEYNEFADISKVYAIVKNTKTKVEHTIYLSVENFVRFGKANKYTDHTVPGVVFSGREFDTTDGHEAFKDVALAGTGSLRATKFVQCTSCGGKTTNYAYTIEKLNGNVVGIMDCLCEGDWDHTVGATRTKDYGMKETTAPVYGTWSAKWNKKLSDPITIVEGDVPSPIVY